MDAVKSFNAELSSLYEVKPPISKAKMTALTRGAIKAIKFYKHVVQSVEKFILKCKPEYKIPGLYVIDSIVRQSRHQFGADKDVFAPRFAKNMQQTFANLYRCPSEDKSKIIRVLNLWQKNQVFAPEVIQPLFDLADPNHPIHREPPPGSQASGIPAANGVNTSLLNNVVKNSPAARTPTRIDSNTSNSLLNASGVDVNMLAQLQQLQQIIFRQQQSNSTPQSNTTTSQVNATGQPVRFDRKLLDFDYGSEDEDDKNTSPINQTTHSANNTQQSNNIATGIESLKNNISVFSILSNPEVLRQLQTLQQLQVGGQQQMNQSLQQQFASQQLDLQEKMRKLKEMKQQEEEFDKHLAQTVPKLPFAAECDLKPIATQQTYKHEPAYILPSNFDMSQPPPGYSSNQPVIQSTMPPYNPQLEGSPLLDEVNNESEIEFVDENNTNNGDVEVINLDQTDSQSPQSSRSIDDRYDRRRRRGSRSRSRDRSRRSRSRDRRRRSRSRSRSRRNRRSRSPRDRDRDREKDKDREKEREKDRERRKRGLPSIKKDHLSVCTTTLWVGHLSKLVHAEELSDTFGEFGDIVSIDLIPPRGCAFIVMNRRQDAARCLSKLRNHKMQGKAITLAWAPGKGVKGKDWKDYWEVELGVSYIPWSKLKPTTDLELLEEGGMIDEDTMPQWMKQKLEQQREMKQNQPLVQQNTEIQLPPLAVTALPNLVPLQTATAGDTNAATGFLSLPETITTVPPPTSSASGKPPPTVVTNVDTTQPPPPQTLQPAGPPGMLQPMALPLVPPFPQLNPRLLGPTMPGMIPPGMIPPNVPIGVPPPNLQPGLLPNSMLSFGQSVLPPPPHLGQLQLPPNTTAAGLTDKPPVPGIPLPSDGTSMSSQETSLLGPGPFSSQIQTVITSQRSQSQGSITGTGQHDDMDIEMEDAEHKDKNVSGNQQSLSDELLASIGKGSGFPQSNQRRDIDERQSLPPHLSFGDLDERRSNSRQHDNRHDRTRDSRDRGSDRNDRNHRDSRDRGGRDRDRDGRRDRDKSRWSDRDRRSDRDDRDKRQLSNRVEKTLSERLQEMANESSRDDSYDNSYSRRGDDRPPKSLHNCGPNNPPSLLDLPTVRPNLLDNPSGPSDSFPPYHRSTSPDSDRNHHERDAGDYDIRMRNTRAPNRILESEFGPNFDSHGGPRHLLHLNDMERIDCDRFEFDSHRESFDRRDPNYSHPEERRLMDDMYDHRNRGGPPHDFFTPSREGFNMRGPPGVPSMIRGGPPGGPDFGPRGPDFCPRGPDFGPRGPMMGGPRGPMPPHLFHPRGMGPMGHRGPRMGPWMDGPLRPNFQPRFVNSDGPPDQFFNSGPNRSFEESPMRGPRRDDNRRRHISEDRITDEDRENNRNRDRRSRWSNISPNKHDESKSEQMYDTQNDIDESNDDRKEKLESKFISDLPFVKKDTNEVDQKFKNELNSENENQMDIDEEKSNVKSAHTTQADIKNIQSPKSETKNIHSLKSDQNNSDVKSEQDKIQLFCKSSDSNDRERDDYKDFKMENKVDITPVDGGATPLRDEQHEENNRDNCKLDKNVESSETESMSTEA